MTGQQDDAALGMTYLRARYYDPATGRFIAKDPYPGSLWLPWSLNRYAYAANRSVTLVDPMGLDPVDDALDFLARATEWVRACADPFDVLQCVGHYPVPTTAGIALASGPLKDLSGPECDDTLKASAYTSKRPWNAVSGALRAFAPGKWLEHFEKHGAEFGYRTSMEYLQGGQRLTGGGKGIATHIRKSGDIAF